MFQKVHLRLTLLFTTVSIAILTIMSLFYLSSSQKNLHQNAMISFQSDIQTLAIHLNQNKTVSHQWLSQMEHNYHAAFYLYDNNIPFRFNQDTKTESDLMLAQSIQTYYHENYSETLEKNKTVHHEFFYDNAKYCAGVISIYGEKSSFQIVIVRSLTEIKTQLKKLYIQFSIIILIATILFFIFSWYYTKKLLHPIQEAKEKQAQFIAAASHEIRNPVNTIQSALTAMKQADTMQQKEFAEIAEKESKRLSALTNDLLTLASSESPAFQLHPATAELDTILLDCYEAFTISATKKEISLSVDLPEHSVSAIHADGQRLKQAISILLDNAISYTPKSGKVHLSLTEQAKTFCISVIDNGVGIDDAYKKQIFQRFYRADASRTDKSHFGLGLCIAKEIINAHHGDILVSDTAGGGATFQLILPK